MPNLFDPCYSCGATYAECIERMSLGYLACCQDCYDTNTHTTLDHEKKDFETDDE